MIGRSLYSDYNCKGTRPPRLPLLATMASAAMIALSAGMVALSFQHDPGPIPQPMQTARL